MIAPDRKKELEQATIRQLQFHLQRDIDGDEQLMKEVWEISHTTEEQRVCKEIMRKTVKYLESLYKS